MNSNDSFCHPHLRMEKKEEYFPFWCEVRFTSMGQIGLRPTPLAFAADATVGLSP